MRLYLHLEAKDEKLSVITGSDMTLKKIQLESPSCTS